MNQQPSPNVEIHVPPNPGIYVPPLIFVASVVLHQPNRFGLAIILPVFMVLAAWRLTRTQSVLVSFDTREATFVYSSLNPFRKNKVVSLAGFSRVYASPFYKNAGWSIHLSGPRGEHLLLAEFPSYWAPGSHDDYVQSLHAKLASGLRIANGGAGGAT